MTRTYTLKRRAERQAETRRRIVEAAVDLHGNEVEVTTRGRHDPCVGIRAVPVGEAMMACVLADQLLRRRAQTPDAPDTPILPRP